MEQQLIQQIKGGDQEAFATLYKLYADYALRLATVVTKNKATAADAVQETFIRVYNNITSFDPTKEFKPWFYRILINECTRLLKGSQKTLLVSDYLENDPQLKHQDTYPMEHFEELYHAIQELDELHRIPIVLKYLNDFSEKEIAEILNCNLNTIKSRLFKGRQKLKEKLAEAQERGQLHG